MSKKNDILLTQPKGYSNNGKQKTITAIIKLYQNDFIWRGAVDMFFIGSLILILMGHIPSLPFFSFFHKTENKRQKIEQKVEQEEPDFSAAQDFQKQHTRPNFSPVQDSQKQHTKAPSKIKISDLKQNVIFPRIWLNNPNNEQKEVLENTANLVGVDNKKAIETAEKYAAKGDVNFQYLLGVIYCNEFSLHKNEEEYKDNIEKALYWYKEAGSQGHVAALYEVGQFYRLGVGSIWKDIQEAIQWYERAASYKEGDGQAENELGRIYENGILVDKDIQKAFSYYMQGAEKGNNFAQVNLGAMYYNGILGERDIEKAVKWTKKGAEQGNNMGQFNLALLYKKGRVSGAPDYNSFLEWAQRAAMGGNIVAMVEIGNYYRTGEGGVIDHKIAAIWYRQAAIKKHPKAQFFYAEMFEQGLGVPQDSIQAYVYYSLSLHNGFVMAAGALENMKSTMSPVQIDHAEKMVHALREH